MIISDELARVAPHLSNGTLTTGGMVVVVVDTRCSSIDIV